MMMMMMMMNISKILTATWWLPEVMMTMVNGIINYVDSVDHVDDVDARLNQKYRWWWYFSPLMATFRWCRVPCAKMILIDRMTCIFHHKTYKLKLDFNTSTSSDCCPDLPELCQSDLTSCKGRCGWAYSSSEKCVFFFTILKKFVFFQHNFLFHFHFNTSTLSFSFIS